MVIVIRLGDLLITLRCSWLKVVIFWMQCISIITYHSTALLPLEVLDVFAYAAYASQIYCKLMHQECPQIGT